ncbi:YfiR family protein [Pantoea rodasii]|uniref:YfiR family protein n=1 Tax=Pantoea rodasii TaxID=1076549 RepID=UPI001FCCCCED|nr:YfiR family protein [Pantoea rodasii]
MTCFIALALLLLPLSLPAAAAQNAATKDDKANRIVSGIISFTHWPALNSAPQLCVFNSARHINFPASTMATSLPFSVVYLNSEAELASNRCDALYFGDQTPQQQTELLALEKSQPVLSLAENNPDCAIGAAFCLIFNADHPMFSVNLDSLARSGVRVSPDVLLLSRKGSQ